VSQEWHPLTVAFQYYRKVSVCTCIMSKPLNMVVHITKSHCFRLLFIIEYLSSTVLKYRLCYWGTG